MRLWMVSFPFLLLTLVPPPALSQEPAAKKAADHAETGQTKAAIVQPIAGPDTIRAIVTGPAGSNEIWQTDAHGHLTRGELLPEYLPLPANLAVVPRSLLASEKNRTGGPLEVLVMGPALQRGDVVEVQLTGMLRLRKDGKDFFRLIAAPPGAAYLEPKDMAHFNFRFAGLSIILETWHVNHLGRNAITSRGFTGRDEAWAMLREAIEDYEKHAAAR